MKGLWLKSIVTISVFCIICVGAQAQSKSKSATNKRSNRFDSAPTSTSDSIIIPETDHAISETTETPTGEKKSQLPFSLTGVSVFSGPPVNDITSAATTDSAIGAKDALQTRNFISLNFKLDDQTTLSLPTLDFNLNFTDATNVDGGPRQFTWNDPFIRLKRASLIKDKIGEHDFNLGGSIDYLSPIDYNSRQSHSYGSVRAGFTPTLQFAHSGFSLSALAFARYWVQSRDLNPKGKPLNQLQFYGGPQINYNFSDKIAAFVLYEAQIHRNTLGQWEGTSVWSPINSLTDIEPGMNFQITDAFSLSPGLNWYCNQPLSTTNVTLTAGLTML